MPDLHTDFIDYKKLFRNRELRLQLINKLAFIPTTPYLKLVYWIKTGRKLNLKNPKDFSEKINWLKVNDIHPEYGKFVDKYEMKQYIASKYGEQYVFPAYGVWEHFDDIEFEKLPQSFVLKCTHDSGSVKFIKEKSEIDFKELKKYYEGRLKINSYYMGREYPYRYVRPRIMAEEYHETDDGKIISDYKLFCFNGRIRILYVVSDRNQNEQESWFDIGFKPIKDIIDLTSPDSAEHVEKPTCFEEMCKFAEELAAGTKFVRVDLYEDKGRFYFGEMTFFPYGGFLRLQPEEWERRLGDWLDIS